MGELKQNHRDLARLQDELDEARDVARKLATQLAKSRRKGEALADAIYQGAKAGNLLQARLRPTPAPKLVKSKSSTQVEVGLLHTTDWQCGKRTSTFNMDVLEQELITMLHKVERITELNRAIATVDECVLFLGGDMVEGVTVFPNQSWEVDATLFDQMFRCKALLVMIVRALLRIFRKVRVFCVYGNHGRLGKPGDFPEGDNADRMVYRIAADELANEDRLEWHHADDWFALAHLGEYKALMFHGHQIKGFGGNLPSYGIVKRTSAWASGVLPPFDAAYVGHFHTYQTFATFDGRPIYIGNTPESGNEYAREFIGATGTPSQRFQLVNPKRGRVTADYELFLED